MISDEFIKLCLLLDKFKEEYGVTDYYRNSFERTNDYINMHLVKQSRKEFAEDEANKDTGKKCLTCKKVEYLKDENNKAILFCNVLQSLVYKNSCCGEWRYKF